MKPTVLAAVWLLGMFLGFQWYDGGPMPVLLLGAAFLALALACRVMRLAAWPALMVTVCLLGLWRFEVSQSPPPPPSLTEGQLRVAGTIVDDPEATATRIKFTLEVSSAGSAGPGTGIEETANSTRLLVYAHPPAELVPTRELPYFRFGDFVNLMGSLQSPEPIDDFDYPAYLESQGIYGVFWAEEAQVLATPADDVLSLESLTDVRSPALGAIYGLRRWLAQGFERALPPTEAALAQALLLGMRGQLPDTVVENFRQSGTSHLLAISGLHLGILLLLTVGALRWLMGSYTPAPFIIALAAIWLYVLTSGAPASVIRAAIMGSVYLLALSAGRPRESLLPSLSLSALVMTALEPGLLAQLSFQLSFAAMAGIALALPWQESLSRFITGNFDRMSHGWAPALGTALGWLASGVAISAAATLATFPLVALHFGQLPVLGIPTTIIATPLLPFALVGGLVAALIGSIHPLAGNLVGMPAAIPLQALLAVVELTPKWTLATNQQGGLGIWAWYGFLLALLVLADTQWYRTRLLRGWQSLLESIGPGAGQPPRSAEAGRLLVLSGVSIILAATVLASVAPFLDGPDGRLHVVFLDVGQGDAILVVTPSGKRALVDGGPEYGGAVRELSRRLPPWDRSLDLVAATHLDVDHSRGLLRALERYRVGAVVAGHSNPGSHLYPQWIRAVEYGDHNLIHWSAGQDIQLDDGVELTVLHPPAEPIRGPAWDSNNNSLALRLSYGDFSFLLTGDIEAEAERYLARTSANLASDVLKAGHHGSNSSTTPAFLRAVQPRWAVISAGQDNQYGHPHPEVSRRLEEAVGEANVFSTATHGTIEFSTDGQRLWVETER